MPNSEEAAAAAAAEMLGSEEAPEEESSDTETQEVDFPNFTIELPVDLAAELEEFDDSDLEADDDEIAAFVEEHGEESGEIGRRLIAAEKKNAHLEKLRVNEAKKNWEGEAKKFFPLAEPFLSEINQTSRRGYLRTAKGIHDRMLPIVEERVLKPARDAIEAAKAEAVVEGKAEARVAWGQPVVSDAGVPSEARVTQAVEQGRRRRGELSDTIKQMLFTKEPAA